MLKNAWYVPCYKVESAFCRFQILITTLIGESEHDAYYLRVCDLALGISAVAESNKGVLSKIGQE